MTRLNELTVLGQSAWLDFIQRSFIKTGKLQELIDQGIRGLTSNPALFEKAIADSNDYDADIKLLFGQGKSVNEIYEALVIKDIQSVAELLHPLYLETQGNDGYVSLEVSPALANDAIGTISEAKRLFAALDYPNVMIKIPATPAGIQAIEAVTALGINVNVTLIFSQRQYEAVALAYIAGLEKLLLSGKPLSQIFSVASLFVSRLDTAVDNALTKLNHSDLLGYAALDNAKLVYARFLEIFSGERWQRLAQAGAHIQRPLWASTGTKNPKYSDTIYVDNLIGKDTVSTIPMTTLRAFLDHGKAELSIGKDIAGARQRLKNLAELGLDLDAIAEQLLLDGVDAFSKAFQGLMSSIETKKNSLDDQARTGHER